MYIPKGYDSVNLDDLPQTSAAPSLFDFEVSQYRTISQVWGNEIRSCMQLHTADLCIIIKPSKRENNGDMHQDYEF